MKVEIRQVEAGDAMVARLLREEFSLIEVEVFNKSLRESEQIWVGLIDDELICLWGLIPASLLSDRAYIWSWTTLAAQRWKKSFAKLSREVIARMLVEYPLLTGLCQGKPRWLEWLGAEFEDTSGYFTPFIIRARYG